MRIRTYSRTLVIKILDMKHLLFLIFFISCFGCIENEPVLFRGSIAEFDATVWNAPAVGQNFPILTRVVGFGRAATTADPLITRTTGVMNVRVNLVSAHLPQDQILAISVASDLTTAIAGVHYTVPSSVTIPANESFGLLPITIINPVVGSGNVVLVLQIDGNETVLPSENFRRLGVRIPLN